MATSDDLQALKLAEAVEVMDGLSEDGFSEIAAIAKLALKSFESPDGYRHLDNIVHALKAIWGKADEIQGCISRQAESVKCRHVDRAQQRRSVAWLAFKEQETAHARKSH